MAEGATVKTEAAFAVVRAAYPMRPCKLVPKNKDEFVPMTQDIDFWVDGPGDVPLSEAPALDAQPEGVRLWVIRSENVVHADEHCAFGATLENGVIKHSNLTGGDAAYSGGELIFLQRDTVAVTAGSGRYGPESSVEMNAVAKAFRDSGYGVWNYGYDDELKVPFRFGSRIPDWVS